MNGAPLAQARARFGLVFAYFKQKAYDKVISAWRGMTDYVRQTVTIAKEMPGVPIKMTRTPGGVHRRSPYLGEDTVVQLQRAGLTDAEIAALIASRAARTYPA